MLDIRTESGASFTVVRLAGELTELDAERLTDVLADIAYGDNARVAVELSGLKTIDSSGLSALITIVTRSRLTQGRVVLVTPSPFVSGILSVTRLDTWFDLCDTLVEAERMLS
ncbi:MAG: STAS domain-containing protein [Phycisphaerales bacterium]|nr:STAS domain-containing protein [Phycisphaerales bacterium]